jgi:hypothetical protein
MSCFNTNYKCGCGQYLGFVDEVKFRHIAMNHTYSCIKKILCLKCGFNNEIIRNNAPCEVDCSCREGLPVVINSKGKEWFITEAKFTWIADKEKILPKIRTIKKIECNKEFGLPFYSPHTKFKSYVIGNHASDRFIGENRNKSRVLSMFSEIDCSLKPTHLDSSVDNIEIKVAINSEVVITYTKISYEENGSIFEVQVLDT